MGTTDAYTWQGRELVGRDGEKIGTVKEIFEDAATGKPEWALVSSGLFGTRSHFVPLAGAEATGEGVRVTVTEAQVKDAPSVEGDDELSEADERRLFEHYGIQYTTEGSTTAQAGAATAAGERRYGVGEREQGYGEARGEGHDVSGPNTDEAMTRSEEELRVGTARRERGRARLRKYVVTEHVQTTVPVQREEVRIEREPITDANVDQATSGPEISEEEHEVVLHEEEPVVEKRVVPRERVRLAKDTVTEEREVSDEVRKERIEGPEGGDVLDRETDTR
ncbi:MAG: PRC and DUF2382 domain-containing protein [Solirubrobacterales bacterium]|nr:PRC and DUF2382 domain-containing protein [Solirubrobacterales bacterium]MBV9716445.1 PRC and DUF2382 domain-containing protein [Solirubrobacterales bacterium]